MSAAAAHPVPTDGVTGWVLDVISGLGAWGAGLLVALENVFPPLPSEIILPLAGFAAGMGRMSLAAAIVLTTLGSVVGALGLYNAGAVLGEPRLRAIATRLPLVDASDIDTANAWFERHGSKAVLLGRLVPLVRSLISVPAGVHRMPVGRFTLLTAVGSLLWNTTLILAGYLLGHEWHRIEGYVGLLQQGLLVLLGVALVVFVVKRLRRPRDA